MCAGDLNNCLGAVGTNGCVPYHVSCFSGLLQSGQEIASIECYTFQGQSGSPVWLYRKSNQSRVIRGVLVAEKSNYGKYTLITRSVFTWLQTYVDKL